MKDSQPGSFKPVKLVIFTLAVVILCSIIWWRSGDSKRQSLNALAQLEEVIADSNRTIPRELVVLPETAKSKSQVECDQWLREVLREELSKDGITALKRSAIFGPLSEVFPESASSWAKSAQCSPDKCFAFRMERNGVTAEVVLVPGPDGFRISRCNNVKQMAELP